MKFEYKEAKITRQLRRRMTVNPEVSALRAYKVRPTGGEVIGIVAGSDLAGKPGWGFYKNDVFTGGFGTRQQAAEKLLIA